MLIDANNRKKTFLWLINSPILLLSCITLCCLSIISVSVMLSACSSDGGSDSTPTATATPTPTVMTTPTPTPTPEATPTPTAFTGWATEQVAWPWGGDWIDLDANDNGELLLSYLKGEGGRTYVAFLRRNSAGVWDEGQTEVQGSENNVMYNKSFIRGAIDNTGDVHIVWADLGRESVYYNKWTKSTGTWSYSPRPLDVIWGSDIIYPDLVSSEDGARQFVISQEGWGAGFNWNYGSGFQSEFNIPIWNENGECKTPRLAIAPDGKVYAVIYDYFFYDNHDQVAINTFDPTTNTWTGWEVPSPVSGDTFPGFPSIAVGKDGSVHLVWFNWHSGTGYDQLVYVFRDSSGTWQGSQVLNSGTMMEEGYNAFFPLVEVNEDGYVMVIWATSMESEGKLRYVVKSPTGSWSQPALVTSSEDQYYPALTVTGKKFVVGWLDKRNNDDYALYVREYIPE